jgi:outer membrane protein TolC
LRATFWSIWTAKLLIVCAGLSGCQSIPLAALLSAPEDKAIARALGAPVEHDDPPATARAQMPAEQVIDLETALGIAGVSNPTIALADEIVQARLAERLQARALLFPTLETGGNYRDHRGAFQSSTGTIIHTNEQSFFYGFGADVKGGGTVLDPGIRLVVHLGDAYYAPQAAEQKVTQSRFDAASTRHYTLLDVGVGYLALVDAQARHAAYRESLKDAGEIARLTAEQVKAGQGRESDAERARAEVLLLQGATERAQEEIGVAAAELARLLDRDPSAALRAADLVPPLYDVVDPRATLPELLETAWSSHPEIVARSADVRYQEILLRQEKVRPFLPLLAVGVSVGEFGGGATTTTPTYGNFSTRTEIYVAAIWSLQNLGLGNRAVQNVARAGLSQAQIERTQLIDRIGREVAEAYSLIQARRAEIDLARRRVETSQRAFGLELTRAKNLLAQPIEVLTTVDQLTAARQDLIRAMVGYSQAQLQLYVALGNPPTLPGAVDAANMIQ